MTSSNSDNGAFSDESPDLLRWRADTLMDEMMLGGVDVSGADGDRKSPPAAVNGNTNPMDGAHESKNGNGVYSPLGNGSSGDGYRLDPPAQPTGGPRNGHEGAYTDPSPAWNSSAAPDPWNRTEPAWPALGNGKDEHANGVYSSGDVGSPAADRRPATSSPAPAGSAGQGGQTVDWPYSLDSNGQSHPASQPANPDGASDAGGYVSAMAVMPGGKKRSTLLPRMSSFDAEALKREINELHTEIAATAMPGSDSAERARHLLDKAYTILQADPMRSAEVEYYMQQVRSIVQRMRQLRRWSNLYRDRLRVYLWAWVLLSALMLVAAYVFSLQVQSVVAAVVGAGADSMLVLNASACLGAIFAGALGSALGTLVNMVRHAQREQGFFDRKYGLRGLILPIIGALGGMLIYAVFAVLYMVLGIEVSTGLVAALIPAAAAFVLGYSQESLFGTWA